MSILCVDDMVYVQPLPANSPHPIMYTISYLVLALVWCIYIATLEKLDIVFYFCHKSALSQFRSRSGCPMSVSGVVLVLPKTSFKHQSIGYCRWVGGDIRISNQFLITRALHFVQPQAYYQASVPITLGRRE